MSARLTLSQVGQRLGRTYNWMARAKNREALYARGFPLPLDVPGRPTWSEDAIAQWEFNCQNKGWDSKDEPRSAPINLAKARADLAARLTA